MSRPAVLTAAMLALGGLAVGHAGPGVTALGPVRQRFFPRLSGLGRADHVALTFDDGPDPAWTPAFLEVLAKWQVRATFFMLGSMAAREPGLRRGGRRGGPRGGRARLGTPVHGAARPPGGGRRPGPGQGRGRRRDRGAAAPVPPALRRAERRGARRRAPARAHPGAVDLLGPGMDGRRPRPGRSSPRSPAPGRRRHGAAARLRLHLAARIRRRRAGRPAAAARRMCHTRPRGWPRLPSTACTREGATRWFAMPRLAPHARASRDGNLAPAVRPAGNRARKA